MEKKEEYSSRIPKEKFDKMINMLNFVGDAVSTEMEMDENDTDKKFKINLADAVLLIYRELKRFNDRVERQDRIQRAAYQMEAEIEVKAEKIFKKMKEAEEMELKKLFNEMKK